MTTLLKSRPYRWLTHLRLGLMGDGSLWFGLRVLGFGWAIGFLAIGMLADLALFGDGAMFAYAIAVRDAWAFHWQNIPDRAFVYVLAHWLPQAVVAATGYPSAGIALYGATMFALPGIGLLLTAAADRSEGRAILTAACASTAIVLPLVFGFPTEMWVAHALLWPCLAMAHSGRRGIGTALGLIIGMVAMMLSHGGGAVFAGLVVASVLLRSWRLVSFAVPAIGFLLGAAVWMVMKLAYPPDAYFAGVLGRAAWLFLDLGALGNSAVVAPLVAAAGGLAIGLVMQPRLAERSWLVAVVAGVMGLMVYWLGFGAPLLTDQRYALRAAVFVIAALLAGITVAWLSRHERPALSWLAAGRDRAGRAASAIPHGALAVAVVLFMVSHCVETCRFVLAWSEYLVEVRKLATGTVADPALGRADFVSAHRVPRDLQPLAWQSTTQYLSILVAPGFLPRRLVVDPDAGYYWLGCATAHRNEFASRAVPRESRAMVRQLSCLHRPEVPSVGEL